MVAIAKLWPQTMVAERLNNWPTNEHGNETAKGLAPNDLDDLLGRIYARSSPSARSQCTTTPPQTQ